MNKTTPAYCIFLLFLGVLGISFAPIFVRYSEVSPTATAFWRVALSVPFFAILFFWTRRNDKNPPTKLPLTIVILPGLFFAGDLALWHWSMKLTTVANSTLLANLACIFVSIVSWKWFGEKINFRFVVGAAAAIVGMIILVGSSIGNPKYLKGDFLALMTALFYASYIVSVKQLRKHLSTVAVMFYATLFCTIFLLPTTLESSIMPTTTKGWLVLLGLALVSHCLGQGLIAYALAHLAASFSSVSLLVQPVLATLWAFLLLEEPVTAFQATGGLTVLIGIYITRQKESNSKTKVNPEAESNPETKSI